MTFKPDWADIHHPRETNNVPYGFPANRECTWCKKSKPRAAGRWVTKSVWVCNHCKKEMDEND